MRAIRARLWEDLGRLRAPEGYLRAGAPRYATLFGRDSLISAWQTMSVDPSIAKATLQILARYQGRVSNRRSEEEPGRILHEHRFDAASQTELPDWEFPYYGSVDSTPLFVLVAKEYLSATNDVAWVRELWPSIEAAVNWMRTLGDRDGDGFLEYERQNPAALYHQGWKDGSEDHLRIRPPVAVVEVQGYAFAAYRSAARIAERLGKPGFGEDILRTAERLRVAVNERFWWPGEGTFYLALNGTKRPRKAVSSNPGHLLFTGIVDEGKRAKLADRLFREDLWTPFGIRTHATSEPDFDPMGYHTGTVWPHDNWIIYTGLRATGFNALADRIRDALFAVYERLGRIPELYAVVDEALVDLSEARGSRTRANPIQAWASGALLEMLGSESSTP